MCEELMFLPSPISLIDDLTLSFGVRGSLVLGDIGGIRESGRIIWPAQVASSDYHLTIDSTKPSDISLTSL